MSFIQPLSAHAPLRERVRAGTPVVGTFVKTTSAQTVEVLGRSGLDFVVLDAEHAPFGRSALDASLGSALGVGLPALVRIADHGPAAINNCLDMGASGVLVPHTMSALDADRIADAVKYERGKRGFSPSGRAGNYGQVNFADYRANADASSNIWCQIEDAGAMDRLDEIAAIAAIDCLFIGPADLGLSLGATAPGDPKLAEAIRKIAEAGRAHRRAVGIFVSSTDQIPAMLEIGITLFICGSDQGFMLGRAKQVATALADHVKG